MQIKENQPLAPYTTFFIGGPSRYLIFTQSVSEIIEAIHFAQEKSLPIFFFGGGSNILVSDNGFDGVAVRIEIVGIDIVEETPEQIILSVSSGEVWDDVVRFACEEGWWGIENLSHIPGFAGAFAVQNVGAYSQEASQVVRGVEVLDLQDNKVKFLEQTQLEFGYRRSIFNTTKKNRYVILATQIILSKIQRPQLSYGDLANQFNNQEPTINDIRQAIIEIRNQKFPFPSEAIKGNCGSFFRGRILSNREFEELLSLVELTLGPQAKQKLLNMTSKLKVIQGYKTPVAFLIEQCVDRNLKIGGAALNPNQPAVILNHSGKATATEVIALFRQVQEQVKKLSGVQLEAEPELIGFNRDDITGLKFSDEFMV